MAIDAGGGGWVGAKATHRKQGTKAGDASSAKGFSHSEFSPWTQDISS